VVRQATAVRRFWSDESGATAIEYGLICAMISVVIIGITATGGGLAVTYNKLVAIISALGGGGNNGGG
jgi:pilus assembly protein Flp/PilA